MHEMKIRVYYEDTDLAGIVYYANYLKFIERGRSEMIREFGIDQRSLKSQRGIVFAVRHVSADYHAPARFDDMLAVQTRIDKVSGARIFLHQDVLREQEVLFSSDVTLVCLDDTGRPARLPAEIRQMLSAT